MRSTRMIGPAMVAALALAAFVTAGSAVAAETTLCKSAVGSPICPAENRYPAETTLETSSSILKIKTSILNVSCESTLKGKVGAEAGEPLPVSVSSWAFTKCGSNKAMSNCSPTTIKNLPFAGALSSTGGANGTMTVSNGGSGEPRLFAQCGESMHCEWTLEPDIAVEGGSPAHLAVTSGTLKKIGGFLCPNTASVEANYTLSSPSSAYVGIVEEPGTQLCKLEESPCAGANDYPAGTLIEAESSNFEIATPSGSFKCGKASLTVETSAAMGDPLPVELTSFPLQGCTFSGSSCEVTTSISDASGTLAWVGGTAGKFGGELHPTWLFKCAGGNFNCRYGVHLDWSSGIEGGSPATLAFNETPVMQEEPGGCPSYAILSADFTVTSPNPLYVVY